MYAIHILVEARATINVFKKAYNENYLVKIKIGKLEGKDSKRKINISRLNMKACIWKRESILRDYLINSDLFTVLNVVY